MPFVVGIDPGLSGAITAIWDEGTDLGMSITDMPTYNVPVGKKTRHRVDTVSLLQLFETFKVMGCELAVMEAVGGRPKQSASGAFTFGWSTCAVYMACITNRIPVETVASQTWKQLLKVPGKARRKKGEEPSDKPSPKDTDQAIIRRADEILPQHARRWRNERGTLKVDRAESAMIAYYGLVYGIRNLRPDAEWRLTYKKAEAGLQ